MGLCVVFVGQDLCAVLRGLSVTELYSHYPRAALGYVVQTSKRDLSPSWFTSRPVCTRGFYYTTLFLLLGPSPLPF